MSKSVLALVTRPLGAEPDDLARITLKMADQIVFLQDGVFNTPSLFEGSSAYGKPGGHRGAFDAGAEVGSWPEKCAALEEDVKARRKRTAIRMIGYGDLVDLIATHEKIITL